MANGRAGLRLTVVDAGPLSPDKNKLAAFASGTVSLPTTVGIIEHPKHGLIMWPPSMCSWKTDSSKLENSSLTGSQGKEGGDETAEEKRAHPVCWLIVSGAGRK